MAGGTALNATATAVVVQMSAAATFRQARREFRHRDSRCGRLLFVGYLAPGTRIEIRCPKCGRLHVVEAEAL